MGFRCEPLPAGAGHIPVSGISEWEHVFYMLPDKRELPEHPVEDCIDAHLAVGMDHIVWNCGRSVVDYRSELPGANPVGMSDANSVWPRATMQPVSVIGRLATRKAWMD
jgi:hypothetical protein